MTQNKEIRTHFLSGSEMVQHHTATYEVHSQCNRLVSLDELEEPRQRDLSRIQEELRQLLSQERVNKSGSVSEGVWDDVLQRVRITHAEGKWQSYGYEDSTGKYVENHEALFLMEMNRLSVKWNNVIVSIEQGYSLFLGRPSSITLEEYQVYSMLSRTGYNVLRYDPAREYQDDVNDLLSVEERCVWGNLYEFLHQPNPREKFDTRAHAKLYETVRRSMLNYNNLIRQPSTVHEQDAISEDTEEPVNKRNKSESQKFCFENDCFNMTERFRRIFDRFDVIRSITDDQLAPDSFQAEEPADQVANPSMIQLVFDLFASASQSFKKSCPPLPIARIIVRSSSQCMPDFKDLHNVYHRQRQRVPLMLMLVSDVLSVHCFLYDLTSVARNIITLPKDSLENAK